MAQPATSQSVETGWIVNAARRMLLSVARLLVGRLPCPTAIQLLREAYIKQAEDQLCATNQRVTKSAISLMTGIDSRAIDQTKAQADPSPPPNDLWPELNVLEAWSQNPIYRDSDGQPLHLPVSGAEPSFQTLATAAHVRNVTTNTILERLITLGSVERIAGGKVRLVSRYLEPVNDNEQAAIEGGSLSFDHVSHTIAHNAKAKRKADRWFHQDRWTYTLPTSEVKRVRREMRQLLEAHVEQLERKLQLEEDYGKDTTGPHMTVGVGSFYWEEGPDPD